MGGSNPYIQQVEFQPATKKFTITYITAENPQGQVIEVDPERIPYGRTGLPGSILDIGLGCGLDIDHACGGVCACSTCHVIVRQGLETCSESTEDEEDQLDCAPGLTPYSRLACQTVPDGTADLVVEVPNWNRNLAKEPH